MFSLAFPCVTDGQRTQGLGNRQRVRFPLQPGDPIQRQQGEANSSIQCLGSCSRFGKRKQKDRWCLLHLVLFVHSANLPAWITPSLKGPRRQREKWNSLEKSLDKYKKKYAPSPSWDIRAIFLSCYASICA